MLKLKKKRKFKKYHDIDYEQSDAYLFGIIHSREFGEHRMEKKRGRTKKAY